MTTIRKPLRGIALAGVLALQGLAGLQSAHAATAVAPPPALVKAIPSPYSYAPQAPSTFTGDAAEWGVGIVAGAKDAVVYLCDGKNPGQWFGATITNGNLEGTAPNGSVVKAKLKSGVWAGTVTLKGKPVTFTTVAATKTNNFGVWRAKPSPIDGGDYVLGWISSPKGIRGISQTATGQVANGIVGTSTGAGDVKINGLSLVLQPAQIPTTTIAGQVLSATVQPGASEIPPDPTKRCLLLKVAMNQASRAADKAIADAGSTATTEESDAIDLLLSAWRGAEIAYHRCLKANS